MNAAVRTVTLALCLLMLAACAGSPSREEVRGFLDANYEADAQRADTWLSSETVGPTADLIAARIDPEDRFTEEQATFMRSREYMVGVFPEPAGSRVEFDDYDRMRTRYLPIIAPFWGRSPGSYGPRGDRGGGFRGGGFGFGK